MGGDRGIAEARLVVAVNEPFAISLTLSRKPLRTRRQKCSSVRVMDATPFRNPSEVPLPSPPGDDQRVTPLMEQYVEIKAANAGCLLFDRMGDFYELFFEDAEVASRALGIVLTKRGKHRGQDIPMCGVPVHRADEYLHRLIAQGHRVAVCEQTEDPAEAKKRGAKSVVQRDVIRLVTAGTLTEESLLDAKRNNYLVAVARAKRSSTDADTAFALAYLDISAREAAGASLAIESATGANLELMRAQSGERRGSLIAGIDRTLTVAGARMLAQRLAAPLTDPAAIIRRLDAVGLFVSEVDLRADVRARLAAAPDLARALARLVVGPGGPPAPPPNPPPRMSPPGRVGTAPRAGARPRRSR